MAEKNAKFCITNFLILHSNTRIQGGGRGVTKMLILAHIGGVRVQKGSNLAHMIYEQPLTGGVISNNGEHIKEGYIVLGELYKN